MTRKLEKSVCYFSLVPFPSSAFSFFFPVRALNSPSCFPPSQFIWSLAVVKGCGSCATVQLRVERGTVTFRWLGTTLPSLLVPSWPCWGDTAILPAINFPHATYGFIDIYSISSQAGETYLFNNSQKNSYSCCFFLCVCCLGWGRSRPAPTQSSRWRCAPAVCTDTLTICILVFISWAQITLELFHRWEFIFFLHRALYCNSSISLSHRKKLWQSSEVSWKKLLRNKCEEWSLRGTIFSRVFSCISLLVLTVWAWSNR